MNIKETGKGWQVVIPNQALGVSRVYTFDTQEDAQTFIEENKLASEQRLAKIATIQEYFKVANLA